MQWVNLSIIIALIATHLVVTIFTIHIESALHIAIYKTLNEHSISSFCTIDQDHPHMIQKKPPFLLLLDEPREHIVEKSCIQS